MFTLFMMLLSSLATLYFARPGFKKAVNYFFSMSDKKTGLADPTNELPVSKEYVDEQYPVLNQPVRRESWKEWDEPEHEWTEQDEAEDGVR